MSTILWEVFREVISNLSKVLAIAFGGIVAPPAILYSVTNDLSMTWQWSLILYGTLMLIALVVVLTRFLLKERETNRLSQLGEVDVYKQTLVRTKTELDSEGVWRERAEIGIEVVHDETVSLIEHYHEVPGSIGRFTSFEAKGHCGHPANTSCQFRYKDVGGGFRYLMVFYFTPPLREGMKAEYWYEQIYSGGYPLTFEEAARLLEQDSPFPDVRVRRRYRILCSTERIVREYQFPKDYEITDVEPEVWFRGIKANTELQRVRRGCTHEKSDGQWHVRWEIEYPKTAYDYYLAYRPPRHEEAKKALGLGAGG